MAMNKKEKALVEDLKIRLALRFTDLVVEDIDFPAAGVGADNFVKGYVFNSYSVRVNKSCSDYLYHNHHSDGKTTTQGSIRQFSTRLLALKAMRNEIELKIAKQLYEVDQMIEKELAQ
jgi:hypothetical protein